MDVLPPMLAALFGLLLVSCTRADSGQEPPARGAPEPEARRAERLAMVDAQIAARGIRDVRVLEAMQRVPRHAFVPESHAALAYTDQPLPIGHGQTISQPYIVALMTEALDLQPGERVLEVGTGSGYQAAVLAEITGHVFSIEIVPELALAAERDLQLSGYGEVVVRVGDGYQGWPEHAPFDAIVLTAAPDHVPQPLVDQLAVHGRLCLPVGTENQELLVLTRQPDGAIMRQWLTAVRFVPMTGEAQER